jgi:hypothetical protein
VCVCVCVCVCMLLGVELRALFMLGKHSTTELNAQPLLNFFFVEVIWDCSLNLGLPTCKVDTLLFEPSFQYILL